MKERMTDRKDVRGVDPKSWGRFDQTVDKITKVMKKVLPVAGLTMATSATIAACNENSPIAEVQPAQSAVLSGLVNSEKLSQITDQETVKSINNDFSNIQEHFQGKYLNGTETVYYILDKDSGELNYYAFGGKAVEGETKKVGMVVLGYHKANGEWIDINEALVHSTVNGAEVYGWVDDNQNSHALAVYEKGTDGKYKSVVMVDPNNISYTGTEDEGKGFLDWVLNFGVTPVEAAYETETPTVVPTATETPVPTATTEATAEWVPSAEDEANMEAIATRMADYLNSTGDFTYEKVRENMFKPNYIKDENYWQNGILMAYNGTETFVITGFNLGLVNLEKESIIIFGTQDVNGNRIIIPVQFLPSGYDNDTMTTGISMESSNVVGMFGTQALIKSRSQFEQMMSDQIGKAFAVEIPATNQQKIYDEIDMNEWGDFVRKFDARLPVNLNMISSVWRSIDYGDKEGEGFYKINQFIESSGGSQVSNVMIKTLEDLRNLEKILNNLPMTMGLATVK